MKRKDPRDNINIVTSILAVANNIRHNGKRVHINWIPSHVGIEGNDTADLAAKDALKLPKVTAKIPHGISSIKNALKN